MSQPSLVELGSVSPEVVAEIRGHQARLDELLKELGRIEVRKSGIVNEVRRLENQVQALVRQEAEVLGIPEGTPWQISAEGKALAPSSRR